MSAPEPAHIETPASPADAERGAERFVEILQTIITGLILAFIMRAFLVEPFIIPTGSMAPTLLGAHATEVCPTCGWEFNFAPLRSQAPDGAGFICPEEIVCPNCHERTAVAPEDVAPKAGDRILVHKWPYATGWIRPHRWDVIVFRDPADPEQHYIKRLVGLPGETIEIIDGDVFINGAIARKPRFVQDVLWQIVYDQSHCESPTADHPARARWIAVDASAAAVGWTGLLTREIRYVADDDVWRQIAFNPDAGRDYLRDLSAYNRDSTRTLVRDVRIRAELTIDAGEGACRWEIVRAPDVFCVEWSRAGLLRFWKTAVDDAPAEPQLEFTRTIALPRGRPIGVEFAHVDYRVSFTIDGQRVIETDDAEYQPDLEDLRGSRPTRPVGIRIAAMDMALSLRGLRIDRDVHYTESSHSRRAQAGHPFALRANEYFVLGDNSADSHDSREWTRVGPHLPEDYRPGTVRLDQIVGRAAFVYLPGLLPLGNSGRWAVPDVGRARFVR